MNQGINESERYLNRLCRNSFLSLWSYAGIYKEKAKELCDVLVVFDKHIIIFSDKYITYPDTGDEIVDWNRWYKKAIKKSADQIYGAERWLLENPNPLFLDSSCMQPFPLNLPMPDEMIIHRIAVAHGAGERCKQYFGDSSGSLCIDTRIIGDEDYLRNGADNNPFWVGKVDKEKGFVHIFDDYSLDIVMKELDTIADFTRYLEKKERLIEEHHVISEGEEDLLGLYLMSVNQYGEHDFNVPSNEKTITIGDGQWHKFQISAEREARNKANKISYRWDDLIEKYNKHIMETSLNLSKDRFNEDQRIIRFLAGEPRLRRRMLGRKQYDMRSENPANRESIYIDYPSNPVDPYYIFMLLPHFDFVSDEEYREIRSGQLKLHCWIAKSMYPNALDIVGIATETASREISSECFIHFDARDWTEDDQINAQNFRKEFNILLDSDKKTYKFIEKDYPDYPQYGRKQNTKPHKIPVNAPCPCGSGKKYKHCCRLKNR